MRFLGVALLLFFVSGALVANAATLTGAKTIVTGSVDAGAVTSVTIRYTTATATSTDAPNGNRFVLDLGAGFQVNANGVTSMCSMSASGVDMPFTNQTIAATGGSVINWYLTRNLGMNEAVSVVCNNIRNPVDAPRAPRSDLLVRIRDYPDANDVDTASDFTLNAIDTLIGARTLASGVTLANSVTTLAVSFTNFLALAQNDILKFTLPTGWALNAGPGNTTATQCSVRRTPTASGASAASTSAMAGITAGATATQVVFPLNVALEAGDLVVLTCNNVRTPNAYTTETTGMDVSVFAAADGTTLRSRAVTFRLNGVDNIGGRRTLVTETTDVSSTTKFTLTFAPTQTVAANERLVLTFPAGWGVNARLASNNATSLCEMVCTHAHSCCFWLAERQFERDRERERERARRRGTFPFPLFFFSTLAVPFGLVE